MPTERISVLGMTCQGCAGSVKRALLSRAPHADVVVSLEKAEATVSSDTALPALKELIAAIEDAGFEVGNISA